MNQRIVEVSVCYIMNVCTEWVFEWTVRRPCGLWWMRGVSLASGNVTCYMGGGKKYQRGKNFLMEGILGHGDPSGR